MTSSKPPSPTLRDDTRAAIASCPGWNARIAARRITREMDAMLTPTGLSLAQVGLMALIAVAEDDRLGGLSQRAGLDPSTLTRNLQSLTREGLVEIVTAEKDQRRRAVWLTETGVRRLEAALPIWRKAQDKLAALQESARTMAIVSQAFERE